MPSSSQHAPRACARRVRSTPVLFAAALLTALAAVGCAPPKQVTVPLFLRPKNAFNNNAFSAELPRGKIYVAPIRDKRPNPEQIGQNLEKTAPVPVYPSGSPTEFVRNTIAQQFTAMGFQVVDSPSQADRIVQGDLTQFWVQETNTFAGDVRAVIEVRDRTGRQLWSGAVAGEGSTFGRSYNPENYQEAFSDATLRMVEALLSNKGFQQALH